MHGMSRGWIDLQWSLFWGGVGVLATWDIRSRKRPFELSLPSSYSLSGGTGSSIQEGNRSRSPVKTQVYGQQIIREGVQRLYERPAKDLFRHDATSVMEFVHQLDIRTHGLASGCPMVVIVQPAHDRKSDHLLPCLLTARNRSALWRRFAAQSLDAVALG